MSLSIYWCSTAGSGILFKTITPGPTQTTLENPAPPLSNGDGQPHNCCVFGTRLYYVTFQAFTNGQVRYWDLNANTDTLLASNLTLSTDLGDISVNSTGTTLYITDRGNSSVISVNTTSGAITTIATGISFGNGIVPDGVGNVYVCGNSIQNPPGASTGTFYKIRISDGTVLASSTVTGYLDGLCLDPSSNLFYAVLVNATATSSVIQPFNAACVAQSQLGSGFKRLDGIQVGGDGNLYLSDESAGNLNEGAILAYNLAGATVSTIDNNATFIDGLAIPPVPLPLAISCGNPTPGTVGNAYTANPSASGGSSPYTYTISSGSLPPGLSMNSSTGAISGTPTASGAGPFYSFAITATDAGNNTATTYCQIPVFYSAAGGGSGLGSKQTELYLWQIQSLPDAVFAWRSQLISHGLQGYQHISRILATYSASAPVTLSFSIYDGTAPSNITLAATNNVPQKVLLTLTSNKFRLIRYSASSSLAFQINLADWQVEVGEWGRRGAYVPYRLIGEG